MKLLALITLSACLIGGLTACSKNKTAEADRSVSDAQIGVATKVSTGEVISVKTVKLKSTSSEKSYGNVGVSMGTGGTAGVHGSVDVATIGRMFDNIGKPSTAQEIIVKKDNGDTVAITQATKEVFKKGDKIKILERNNKSVVIH